jgi:DNA repair exonuclease SbcCD nuclease subunit
MLRTRTNKKVTAILTSDWHLREDTPTCFTGDWDQEQWDSILFIKRLQATYECPVIHAGDMFHHWKPSPYLLTKTIKYLPEQFYTIYGQHDLPQHNLDLAIKSGINVLETAGILKVLPWCHYGQDPDICKNYKGSIDIGDPSVLVWHHMTYMSSPFPGATDGMALGLVRKYPQFDLIITGDNHQSFYTEFAGRLLVNPGCITRQTADQIDFKPRVYLWYADTNTVKPIYLPTTEGTISREHIEHKEQRDARIDAFVNRIDGEWDVSISFEENLEEFKKTNRVHSSIMEIVYEALEPINE